MLNKRLLIFFIIIIGGMTSVVRADVRTDVSIGPSVESVEVKNPRAEKKCMQAFVKSNFSYAYHLCRSLAQQGMRDAQLVTGLLYIFGQGTAKNPMLAKMWLQKASRSGSMEARQILIEFNLTN